MSLDGNIRAKKNESTRSEQKGDVNADDDYDNCGTGGVDGCVNTLRSRRKPTTSNPGHTYINDEDGNSHGGDDTSMSRSNADHGYNYDNDIVGDGRVTDDDHGVDILSRSCKPVRINASTRALQRFMYGMMISYAFGLLLVLFMIYKLLMYLVYY